MGIRLDRYVAEQVKMFGTAQHALYLQEIENLKEFFDITLDDDGNIVKLTPKEYMLDLIDRMGYIAALDLVHERTAIEIEEAEIEFETDIDVVHIDKKDDDDHDGFAIETSTKKKGLFKDRSYIKMKIKVKGKPESQSIRFLRTHFQQHFMDELQGFPKKDRSKQNNG